MSLTDLPRGFRPYIPAETGEPDVTVCVAAITTDIIIGASDRMITAGDVLFQPGAPKTVPITSSIVAMMSGDATLVAEVLTRVKQEVRAHIERTPDVWLAVREVADRYAFHWAAVRQERAERALLWPLGLTSETFLSRQAQMDANFVRDITDGLLRFAVPSTACIFAGVDTNGTHLFHVENGNLIDLSVVGFATSGSGGRHAASQLMLAQHSRQTRLPETLFLVYSAKRRAEVAPGVGSETDLWMVGPQLGSFMFITDPDTRRALETQYSRITRSEKAALDRAKRGISSYIESLGQRRAPPTQMASDSVSPDPA